MSARTQGIIIAAVGFFLILAAVLFIGNAYFGWTSTLASQRITQPQLLESKKTQVVVLRTDKYLGDILSAEDLQVTDAPVDIIPRNVVTTIEEATGRFLKTDMAQGEMLLKHNIADPTNKNGDLSYILSDDHVLYAFPVGDLMNKEGIVHRGDIVDLYATLTESVEKLGGAEGGINPTPGESGEKVTRTFTLDTYQRLSVTALVAAVVADENTTRNPTTPPNPDKEQGPVRTYLLALPPQDALVLKYLVDKGTKFDVVLRSPTSTAQFDLTPVTEEYIIELLGLGVLP